MRRPLIAAALSLSAACGDFHEAEIGAELGDAGYVSACDEEPFLKFRERFQDAASVPAVCAVSPLVRGCPPYELLYLLYECTGQLADFLNTPRDGGVPSDGGT